MLGALELAEMGRETTSPNPMVGALVVAGGEVVGEGFHERAGGPHAEVGAIAMAGEKARGATLYVTLEPCSHEGRTLPCADMIVRAGISTVVMAMGDPNPLVAGRGERILKDAGLEVRLGPYTEIATRLNESYVKWITTGTPFVTLKMAMSMDGKVATKTGDSEWVTSEEARADVHDMRAASGAVMVGIGTVLRDDPRLTARNPGVKRQPARVVVDSMARTPLESKVLDLSEAPTIVAVTARAHPQRVELLRAHGAEVIEAGTGGQVDLQRLMKLLGEREVTSVLAEGGPTVAASLLASGTADKVVFFVAPKVVGGADAPGPVAGDGVGLMADAVGLVMDSVEAVGPDVKLTAYAVGRA
jgi:diaminohydroxyphosphoribosylaminopyrimidine deaminase/5-amino-6-(5-phosphoribosylamino)uracil reductase